MNPERRLHVVCLNVPYPTDYGGACEMFYKMQALSKAGIEIILHCYDYGRGRQPVLDRWCRQVYYYPRNQGHKGISLTLPYIVTSRAHPELAANLTSDDAPVLFEGVHTTYPLYSGQLGGKKCFIRMHNLEHLYYKMLSRHAPWGFRKLAYANESRLLRSYERTIAPKAVMLAMTNEEACLVRTLAPAADVRHLPVFTGRDQPECQEGEGSFCLYHGDLSVPENDHAATWLLTQVFDQLEIPFVVAGKQPRASLRSLAYRRGHTCIVEDPSARELDDLVRRAQVHVLPSFSSTGVKFKLLHAVFAGRHVLANPEMLTGTCLDKACHIATDAASFRELTATLFRKRFECAEIEQRSRLLEGPYCDLRHAELLISWLGLHGR